MRLFVHNIILVFISALKQIVITNCQSTNDESGKIEALEQLLLEVKSNFDELRSEMQLLKHTMDKQQREIIRNVTERVNDVMKQTNEQCRYDHQDLLQRLTAMMNTSTATALLRLEELDSHVQQPTAQRLELAEKMLLKTNATDQCAVFDDHCEVLNDFNRSIQWMRSRVDHLTTTSGRRRLVSIYPVESRNLSGVELITGLAVMNNELYVGRRSVIEIYDVATLSHRRYLSIPELRCVRDLASCPQCDVVHISEGCDNKIYAVDKHGFVFFNKPTMGTPDGSSVNSLFNVIVTLPIQKVLREFSPRGELIRNITLQSDMRRPWHAIQLDYDRYSVVHGDGSSLNRVCIINRNGTLIESYEGDPGSGAGQLKGPGRMLIFGGSMIVADHSNKQLLLFSVSPLHYARELISTFSGDLTPLRMANSEDSARLFVSCWTFDVTWI